ncbi:MAG: FixH family protein [Bacillaceae bacterium]
MKKVISIVAVLFVLLAGCSQGESKKLEEPKMLNVDVKFNPTSVKVNEEFTVQAIVTMGDEKVDDASEVMFELWKKGQEDHEMIEGVKVGDGVYELKKKVNETGTYIVVSHVTARNLHNMPKVEFEVTK